MSLNNQTHESGFTSSSLPAVVGVILLGGALGILNSTMVAVGIDRLAGEFGTSLGTIGWVSTGFLLAVTVTIPVTGWAADRVGGKRMWLAGLGLFLLGSLAAGLSWDAGSLIAFRVLQGIGAGILDPLVLILLARAAGPHRAGQVMGLMAAVLSLGPVLGPAIGGVVLQGLGWRWMFLISVPVGVVAFVLARRVMPGDPPTGSATRLDVLGVALLGPGFAGVLLTFSQAAKGTEFVSWPVLIPLVAGVVLLGGYAMHAMRSQRPLVDLRLFARGGFTASVTVMALTGVALYVSLVVLPLYFQQARGHGALASGLLVAPLGIGAAVAAPLAGRLSDRLGSRALALGGGSVAALSAFTFTWIDAETPEIRVLLTGLAIGAGLGFVGPPAMGSIYRTLPGPLVPQGSSVIYMLNQLGGSVGVAMVALVMETTTDPVSGVRSVYWLLTGAIVAMLAAAALLPAAKQGSMR
ncbi:DHA2 family efflux MFS transporter permease subunit [Kibdelosporangium phytohabitans]|uniref:EmrB/QacA family drug resistance transporter n=1 Tax=Kibdelosporangium phytohabitans TaxID=860235 RepID=A0A0N9I2V8_9PSEU|nr:DHA2 family efflux MFS transporter permease subunit [Kibdelosporangium phytohabitans]ALG08562.1 EmrB/QacA family drug resistance transporter [Kibdelosporangium phytohabitans]MBE1470359.1 EmrB/QacA subfamily drug resistance transporter [Kibdelosporangium phytohabitans]